MVTEITPRELKASLDNAEQPLVLDVREDWELAVARLPNVVHIPMGQIPARLAELDPARETVVMCRSGGRSLQVAQFLKQQGFSNVANLTGGILRWGQEVDPTLAAY
jgi:rhodanese-related sulfurtransferase